MTWIFIFVNKSWWIWWNPGVSQDQHSSEPQSVHSEHYVEIHTAERMIWSYSHVILTPADQPMTAKIKAGPESGDKRSASSSCVSYALNHLTIEKCEAYPTTNDLIKLIVINKTWPITKFIWMYQRIKTYLILAALCGTERRKGNKRRHWRTCVSWVCVSTNGGQLCSVAAFITLPTVSHWDCVLLCVLKFDFMNAFYSTFKTSVCCF